MTPQELRNSIINKAIAGKLVNQIDGEKPVDVKQFDGDIGALFSLPKSWKWVSLKSVVTINTGLAFKKEEQLDISTGDLRVLRGGNIGDKYDYVFLDNDIFVKKSNFLNVFFPLKKGDVITPAVTSIEKICKTGYIEKDYDYVTAGGFVYVIRVIDPTKLNSKFLQYFISSSFNKKQCKPNIHKSGQAFFNLKKSGYIEQPICVPPLEEQKRIVAKIEELLSLVDKYEEAWTKLEKFNNDFPNNMKRSLLNYAYKGLLVEQNELIEGNAEILYNKIQDKKRKLKFKISNIDKNGKIEQPYFIPQNWKWCRWGELATKIQYGYNASAKEFGSIKMLRISDIHDNVVDWDSVPFCEIDNKEIEDYLLEQNDILFARTGGTVGKSFIIKNLKERSIFAGYLIRTQYFNDLIEPMFLKYFMETDLYWKQLKKGTIATAQPNCNGQTLSKMLLPLPPLEEQKRIVAKIEELLPLCKSLQK